MNDIQQVARAHDADAILQHPLIAEALADYEATLTEAWKNSKAKEGPEREELHRMLRAHAHFREYLTQVVVTGQLIKAQVRKASPLQRVKEAIRG